jgi:hypothetical protein
VSVVLNLLSKFVTEFNANDWVSVGKFRMLYKIARRPSVSDVKAFWIS